MFICFIDTCNRLHREREDSFVCKGRGKEGRHDRKGTGALYRKADSVRH